MSLTAHQRDALARLQAAAREIETAAAVMQDALVELQLAAAELGVDVSVIVEAGEFGTPKSLAARVESLDALARAARHP